MDRDERLYRSTAALPVTGFELAVEGEESAVSLAIGEYWEFFPTGACTLTLQKDGGGTFNFPLPVGVGSVFRIETAGTITVAPIGAATGTLYVSKKPVIKE